MVGEYKAEFLPGFGAITKIRITLNSEPLCVPWHPNRQSIRSANLSIESSALGMQVMGIQHEASFEWDELF